MHYTESPKVTRSLQKFAKITKVHNFLTGVGYYLSSSVNPLLYSVMSKRFRRGFRDMFNRNKSLTMQGSAAGGAAVNNIQGI